ncbi:hypothetical protein CR920_10355 [Stenotrophomonas indicatrix]|nr:hypothetical protein CR920_10355 [Stenotrophomonas indicatrix]
MPAAGRKPQQQQQKLAFRGMAGGVGLRGRRKYVLVGSAAPSMARMPRNPTPPRLRQFRGVCWSICASLGSNPIEIEYFDN